MELDRVALEEIEGICSDFGFELVTSQLRKQRDVVRIELVLDKPGGITVEDCALAAERIGAFLDASRLYGEDYSLRVSSPGLDYPLVKPEHFKRFVGSLVKVTTRLEREGRKHFDGRLVSYAEDVAIIELQDGSKRRFEVPFDEIAKANVQYEWDK